MFAVVKKKKPKTLIKAAPKRDKSKVRSVSVSKSKENVRVKTKPDVQNNEESKARAKAFISLNQELDGNKHNFHSVCQPQQKRRRTPQQRKTKTNSSQSQLLKNDVKKRQVHSAMDNKRKSKEKLKYRATKLPNPPSRKPRLQIDVDDIPGMELANQDHLLSVTSSGDIVYSSQQDSRNSSRRDLSNELSKPHFQVDPNALLRIHLKKDHKKRVTAAIKIQKIWRGYQTRKLLDKVLTDIIKDYKPKRDIEESHSQNNFQNFAPLKKSERGSGLSFNTAKISQDMPHELIDCSQIKPIQQIDNLHIVINPNQQIQQSSPTEKQTIDVQFKPKELKQQPRQLQQPSGSQSDDEQPVDILLYRHQRAIYSYEDIHEYLQESQRRKEATDEEEDEFEQEYHEVILETNEQYIQSRKNSTQTKKNKTIESRKQSKDDPFDVRKFSKQSANIESRKRSQEMSIKKEEIQKSVEKELPTEVNMNTENLSTKSDYKDEVLKLRRDQIERWTQMIEMIQTTMKKSVRDTETEKILQKMMEKSEENRKALEGNTRKDVETVETRLTTHEEEIPNKPKFLFENKKQEQYMAVVSPADQPPQNAQKTAFRRKNLQLDIQNIEGTFKNGTVQQIAPAVKSRSDASGLSRQMQMNWNLQFQSNKASARKAIKEIIQQNLVSLSNSNLNNIINIRQEMLKERKEIQEQRLRKMLTDRRIEMHEFQNRMMSLMEYVESQKIDVQRARRDIEKGLRVAAQVAVKTQRDARLLGKGVGLSRSADHLTKSSLFALSFDTADRLIVDELPNRRSQPKNFFCGDEMESDSDGSSINEEQLKKYKDGKYGSSQLSDMNKNIMIQEFLKSHKTEHFKQKQEVTPKLSNKPQNRPLPESAPLSPMPDSRSLRTQSNMIVQSLLQKLIVECAAEIFRRPCVYETVSSRLGLTANHPKPISRQQIFQFINLVENKLPEESVVLQRLNQQIAPPPLELLKCMRVDFYEEEQISQEQLGRYEFVIPQSSCTAAIRDLEAKIRQQEQAKQITTRPQNSAIVVDDLDGDLREYVEKKERIWQRRANQLLEKRAEVLNIEMHCVFDCWNEQIIHLKNQLPGFSGIGLNEPTLALKDHNKPVLAKEVKDYMEKSKQKLVEIITDESPLNQKISSMSLQEMCQNEASWICYTDQSLGYVLEVDYIIGEELMAEVARFLHQRRLKII